MSGQMSIMTRVNAHTSSSPSSTMSCHFVGSETLLFAATPLPLPFPWAADLDAFTDVSDTRAFFSTGSMTCWSFSLLDEEPATERAATGGSSNASVCAWGPLYSVEAENIILEVDTGFILVTVVVWLLTSGALACIVRPIYIEPKFSPFYKEYFMYGDRHYPDA